MRFKNFKHIKQLFMTSLCVSSLLLVAPTVQANEYAPDDFTSYSENEIISSDAPYIFETFTEPFALNKSGEATLTWNPQRYSEVGGITYEVEFSKNADFSDAVTYTVSEPSLTLSIADFGKNGGNFYYRVRYIENGYIYNSWSNTGEVTYVKINKTNFPGMYKLLQKGGKQMNFNGGYDTYTYDTNGDGWLDPYEIHQIYGLYTSSVKKTKNGKIYYEPHVKVSSLKGIEYLHNLSTISLYQYSGTKIDCSQNSQMRSIWVRGITSKQITVISPTANDISVEATYENKNFTKTNLKKCPNAHTITAYRNNGTANLVLPKDTKALRELSVSDLGMKALDLNSYKNLQLLYVYNSDIANLKINKCTDLRYLYFYYCSKIKSLDLSKNKKLIGFATVSAPGLTEKTVKGYKNAKKVTFNSKNGKWWYGTEEYNKLKQSFNE